MNHCVPDFELDEDYNPIPTTPSRLGKKSPFREDDIMELLWQNGQVVVQSQNQRSLKRSRGGDSVNPAMAREMQPIEEPPSRSSSHLFMLEDEMASWLHYPMDDSSFDRDLYADLLYPAASAPVATHSEVHSAEARLTLSVAVTTTAMAVATRPPIPLARRADNETSDRFHNFLHFSRPSGNVESGPTGSNKAVVTSTVVESRETPKSRASYPADRAAQDSGANLRCGAMSGGGAAAVAIEMTVTSSSPGDSGASASASAEPVHKPVPTMEDRKQKGKETDEVECHSEDVEFESPDAKRQVRGSTSAKKSRAAEVHNLSERRRRDRINEKMKALQKLIPRCNKSDKASMLDEAIEYLKSLQLQVQMMSMGCGMVPMMYPGVQHYMPPMGMGMGTEMGMNRPMMPFPSALAGSAVPTSAAAAATHLGPRFPLPAFLIPRVPLPDPSRMQLPAQFDPTLHSVGPQNSRHPRMPIFPNPYQQYLGLQQTLVPLSQSQARMQPGTSKPNAGRRVENFKNHQSG